MRVLKIKQKQLQEIDVTPFKLEKDIQTLIENNTQTLFGLEFVATELAVGKYRLDSLCISEEEGSISFVIIEYKKGNSYSVIDQGYTYLQLLLNNKSDFVLTLSHHLNKVLKVDDIDWSQSKIIFVSQSFNAYQKDSVNFKDLPFELHEVKRFDNNTLIINKHETTSKESIELLSNNKSNSTINAVNKELVSYNEEYHIKKASMPIVALWQQIKEHLLASNELEINSKKHYISITYNTKALGYFHLRKSNISIDIPRGNINVDGSKSKNYFEIDDPKKITTEKSWQWKNGAIGNIYNIKFKPKDDIDYLLFLLRQKFKNLSS